MPFSVQTLTSDGAQLLALATISDRLIISGCDADNTVLNLSQAQAISSRPANPVSNTTVVTNLGVTNEHIQCRAYFHAGDVTGGDVHTFYLYGYLESAPSYIYVIYVLSDSNTTRIPTTGDTFDEMEILFDITYNVVPNAIGFATQATYATQAQVNELQNIMVTTHTFGDPTTGDTQSILGHKTFVNGIHIPDTEYLCIGSDDTTKMLGDDTFFSISHLLPNDSYHTFFSLNSGGTENISLTFTPNGTGKIKLYGDTELGGDVIFLNDTTSYKDLYIRRPHANTIFSLEVPDYIDPPSGDIREDGSSIILTEENSIGTILRICVENGYGGTVFDSDVRILGSLGCDDAQFQSAYISTCHCTDLSTNNIGMNTGSYGPVYNIEAVTTGTDLINRSGNIEISLLANTYEGSTGNYFYIKDPIILKVDKGVTGLQPKVSSNTLSVPIGGIVMHYKNDSADVSIGDMITINNATTSQYRKVAKNNAGTWQAGDKELPNGKYAFLHEASGTGIPVLLQRVE